MVMDIFVIGLAIGRIVIGLAPIVAAGPSSRLLGFPGAHDSPTTRLFARMFGVRDIGLGVLVLWALGEPSWLGFAFLFNAAHDVGDVAVISVPLIRRQGLGRPAGLSLVFALGGGTLWMIAWWLTAG